MKKEIFFLIIIFLLSVAVVAFKFNQIPKNLAYDEIKQAELALSLNNKQYVAFSPIADGHPTFYFYIELLSIKLFGVNGAALRLPSAIFGIISPILVYIILEEFFNKKKIWKLSLPFVLTIIFITLHWRINFARFSFEVSNLLFWELSSALLLVKFLKNKSTTYLFLSGITTGLVYNCYQPGRIFFIAPLIILLIKKVNIKSLLVFLLPFIILATPMTVYLYQHAASDIRINQLSYYDDNISWQTKTNYFGENILRTALMFDVKGDGNGRHNYPDKPAINPILGIFFIAGVIFAIVKWKKDNNLLFLSLFAIMLAPTLLVYPIENPSMLRTYPSILPLIFFIGLGLRLLVDSKQYKKIKYAGVILITLILVSSLYELRTYFVYQNQVFPGAFNVRNELKTELTSTMKKEKDHTVIDFSGLK